ncbi:DNA polymerase III subunit epsilon [Sulfuriflexus sp.]|uniref:DNA polymerase III subunit epsilon n=1 Tax=Sulfuriflexus sp. TaxID=2015443 RepID=UPI0028CE1760|nr:DNA polymerase III subunit epsilon [Sulfuriflexus sp.]MDT8403422.1 DNA polymerase III subunit epsilon [Sulfuriflexus sp.]
MRQIVLDTETTGLDPREGHRIIEIGCVEMLDRRLTGNDYHQYLQPDREIDAGAMEVHGISNEMLADKPRFAEIADDLLAYLKGAELIIHNAPFDIGFLNHEWRLLDDNATPLGKLCQVTDSLAMARQKHPGQKNTLDALCKRYDVDNSQRELHGALLDARILSDVYLAMTGGQGALSLDSSVDASGMRKHEEIRRIDSHRPALRVIEPNAEEMQLHAERLDAVDKACAAGAVWRRDKQAGEDCQD